MSIVDAINSFYYRMSINELKIMNEGDAYSKLPYNSVLIINIIEQIPDCTISKLARALCVTKSAVTIRVNELCAKGVVLKKQSETDKRVFILSLSDDMKKYISTYDRVLCDVENQLRRKYTSEQLQFFIEILNTINEYDWERSNHEQESVF